MTSLGFGAHPPRLSDDDRERALEVLREGAVAGRISHDTFERRSEVVLRAQWQGELHAVLGDLALRRPRGRRLAGAVARIASWPGALRHAWRTQRLPELLLPPPGRYPYTIGRAPGSMLRLGHHSVSRSHAQLSCDDVGWRLRDLGSSNGTWVNGCRVTASVPVGPGDAVHFGQVGFRLTLPPADRGRPAAEPAGRPPAEPDEPAAEPPGE